MSGDPLSLAQIAFAALGDIAFACALGALLLDGWLCSEQAFASVSPAHRGWRRAARTGAGAAILLVLCNFFSLWLLSAAMSGSSLADAGASLWLVSTATYAGVGWSIACVGSVLFLLAMATGRKLTSSRLTFGLFGALIAAAGKSAIGHAADAGAFSLPEIVQTVHLLATAAWGGVVIAGALFVLQALDMSVARVSRAHRVAHVACGCRRGGAGDHDGRIQRVARNRRIGDGADVERVGLCADREARARGHGARGVATALAVGALNRWRALPRLQYTASATHARTVIRAMRIETIAMIGVFVAASVLSHSVPGMSMMGCESDLSRRARRLLSGRISC